MYRVESIENQQKFVLPYNPESMTLYYNQRLIVSAPVEQGIDPIAWRISKVESADPLGIQRITLYQDKFDQYKDYIERDPSGKVIAMWADYFSSTIPPIEATETNCLHSEISYNGLSRKIKINGSPKKLSVKFYDSNHKQILPVPDNTWTFKLDGKSIDDTLNEYITVVYFTKDSVTIQFIGSDDYLGSTLTVENTSNEYTSSIDIEIAGM